MFNKIKQFVNQTLPAGIIIALITFGLTYYFSNKYKEISYIIEPTDVFLKNPTTNKVEITVNGIPVQEVYSHRIKIQNSGDLPIRDIPFTFSFPLDEKDKEDFKIINLSYSTIPRKEFGKIEEVKKGEDAMGMKVELLNPGDEINVSIITNQKIQPAVYSKAEGVFIQQGTNSQDTWYRIRWGILSCGGVLLLYLYWYDKKRNKELERILNSRYAELDSNLKSMEERVRNAAAKNEAAKKKLLDRLEKLGGGEFFEEISENEDDDLVDSRENG